MIVHRRVAFVSYINVFFSQSYINDYATGQLTHVAFTHHLAPILTSVFLPAALFTVGITSPSRGEGPVIHPILYWANWAVNGYYVSSSGYRLVLPWSNDSGE